MAQEDIAEIVRLVVERVARRLEDKTHGDLPTAADERLFGERLTRLRQAVEQGARRLTPQVLPLDRCAEFAPMVEMTLLRPDARERDILDLCSEAVERRVAAVCLALEWTETAAEALRGSPVRLAVPAGFPTGGLPPEAKAAEVRRALSLGADEVDFVLNTDRLRAADYRAVLDDLQGGVRAALGRPVKAVIEAASLASEQKVAAAVIAKAAGAAYVKSSTGFGPDGVTVGDVALIRSALEGRADPTREARPEWEARVGAAVSLETGATARPS